jgi:hypothetical protein
MAQSRQVLLPGTACRAPTELLLGTCSIGGNRAEPRKFQFEPPVTLDYFPLHK